MLKRSLRKSQDSLESIWSFVYVRAALHNTHLTYTTGIKTIIHSQNMSSPISDHHVVHVKQTRLILQAVGQQQSITAYKNTAFHTPRILTSQQRNKSKMT